MLSVSKPMMISYTSGITVRFTCDENCLACWGLYVLYISCFGHVFML